jgi:hypothetical protein
MENLLYYGTQITAQGDVLKPVTIERLFQAIFSSRPDLKDKVAQLRTIRTVDERQYRALKKQLPYFVCGRFHPPVRRRENFAAIQYFMLDLDHLGSSGQSSSELKARLRSIPEVVMCFVSPSGDGVKVMCRLSEPCTDAALFSAFYKLFTPRFAEKWGLREVIDLNTSDVTRACFFSVDPEAFFNQDAGAIELKSYLPDLNFDKAEREIKQLEKEQKVAGSRPLPEIPLDADILGRIKQKLNPGSRERRQKNMYIPPEVDEVIGILSEKLQDFEIQLVSADPINYGRKLKVAASNYWAEINIFYGRRGYSVVRTTKSGSNEQLAILASEAIAAILTENET